VYIFSLFLLVILAIIGYGIAVDRKEYAVLDKEKDTAARQRFYRKWIATSWLFYGLPSIVGLLILSKMGVDISLPEVGVNLVPAAVSVSVIVLLLTVATLVQAKRASADDRKKVQQEINQVSGGSIIARNSSERRLAAVLSLSAGINEELFFRAFLPVVIIGLIGSDLAILAIVISVVIFGAVHLYQGLRGIMLTGIIGAVMMVVYLATGSIFWPIVLHIIMDIRSTVVISYLAYGN
jgi:protease, CAAX amino terminal family